MVQRSWQTLTTSSTDVSSGPCSPGRRRGLRDRWNPGEPRATGPSPSAVLQQAPSTPIPRSASRRSPPQEEPQTKHPRATARRAARSCSCILRAGLRWSLWEHHRLGAPMLLQPRPELVGATVEGVCRHPLGRDLRSESPLEHPLGQLDLVLKGDLPGNPGLGPALWVIRPSLDLSGRYSARSMKVAPFFEA
jgi:hypothetical protein